MRPDGAGTDERITPEERRKAKPPPSVERDVMRLAIIFTLVAAFIYGAYFLRNRATMPDLSSDNPALQQEQ